MPPPTFAPISDFRLTRLAGGNGGFRRRFFRAARIRIYRRFFDGGFFNDGRFHRNSMLDINSIIIAIKNLRLVPTLCVRYIRTQSILALRATAEQWHEDSILCATAKHQHEDFMG